MTAQRSSGPTRTAYWLVWWDRRSSRQGTAPRRRLPYPRSLRARVVGPAGRGAEQCSATAVPNRAAYGLAR